MTRLGWDVTVVTDRLWASIEVFVVVVITEGAAGGRCQWCIDGVVRTYLGCSKLHKYLCFVVEHAGLGGFSNCFDYQSIGNQSSSKILSGLTTPSPPTTTMCWTVQYFPPHQSSTQMTTAAPVSMMLTITTPTMTLTITTPNSVSSLSGM